MVSGTLAMAITYILLICDTIVAGYFFGEDGVAAVYLLVPISSATSFLSSSITQGTCILYSRYIGAMDKRGADQIYGQGLIVSCIAAIVSFIALHAGRDLYFHVMGESGHVLELACEYYKLLPVNTVLSLIVQYINDMVYTDGDEKYNNISYLLQIGGNIIFSVLLCYKFGMIGIIAGTVVGNLLGMLALTGHYVDKSNTLHFVWYLNLGKQVQVLKYSIVDSIDYLCWTVVDYVMIAYVTRFFGGKALVALSVVSSLLEAYVIMEGIGMAIQPLIGAYYEEKNHTMIRHLMGYAFKTAIIEGVFGSLIILILSPLYVRVFGIHDPMTSAVCVKALRIVCLSMTFSSIVTLIATYYMLMDYILLALGISTLTDGILYIVLPIGLSRLFGETGIWMGFAFATPLSLFISLSYVFVRYRQRFPLLLPDPGDRIVVFERKLDKEAIHQLSAEIAELLTRRGYEKNIVMWASLFAEEIPLTILEKNKEVKKLLLEMTLQFEEDSILIIERDSGEIFDLTDPEMKIDGISSFILERLLHVQKDKSNQTTTGYNRNLIRLSHHCD